MTGGRVGWRRQAAPRIWRYRTTPVFERPHNGHSVIRQYERVVVGTVACGASSTSPDTFAVHFDNDLGQPVVLALCKSDHSAKCEHSGYRDRVAIGQSYPENIEAAVRTEWAVQDVSGRNLHCVVLYWSHYPGIEPHIGLSTTPLWADPCPRPST